MNGNSIRANLASSAVLLALVVTMGTANPGQTAEQTLDEACERAVWPMIPATCFGRQNGLDFYPGGIAVEAAELSFIVDRRSLPNPMGAPGKADLLQPIDIDEARYRTIETRGNGISFLRRVKVQ